MSATHHAVSGSCVFANQLPRFGISGVANYSLSTVRFATHSYRPRLRTVGKRVNHSGLFEFIIEQETRKASPANTLQHCRLRASVTLAVSASLAESWKSGRGAFGRLHRRLAKLH